jgi:hypothetical protein
MSTAALAASAALEISSFEKADAAHLKGFFTTQWSARE